MPASTTTVQKRLYACARDWAQDLRFDPMHTYLTGMPFSGDKVHLNEPCKLLACAFSRLSDEALKAL